MAIRVQDDNGTVARANAYADEAYVRAYWGDRGTDLTATADADIQAAIVNATQFLDTRYIFIGYIRNQDQPTEWPRFNAWDRNGWLIQGVPEAIKEAMADLANRALTASLYSDPTRDATGRVVTSKSESVGPISESTTYGGYVLPEYDSVTRLLVSRGLTRVGIRAVRA